MEDVYAAAIMLMPIAVVVLYFVIRGKLRGNQQKRFVCVACGALAGGNKAPRGSLGVEILLWLLLILPGLIYTLWRQTTYRAVCDTCGGDQLVPADSPVGRRLLNDGQG